ncbi:MAG: hypothetical protein QME81_18075 [bacterium]|nr:hypothetical protein [bacterium]
MQTSFKEIKLLEQLEENLKGGNGVGPGRLFDGLSRPLAKVFLKTGLGGRTVLLLSWLTGLWAVISLTKTWPQSILGAILIQIYLLLDYTDVRLIRAWGIKNLYLRRIDHLSDRGFDFAFLAILSFTHYSQNNDLLGLAIGLLAILSNFLIYYTGITFLLTIPAGIRERHPERIAKLDALFLQKEAVWNFGRDVILGLISLGVLINQTRLLLSLVLAVATVLWIAQSWRLWQLLLQKESS